MSKVWLLYHGTEDGDAEDCSIFYTACEVFDDETKMKNRQEEIKKRQKKAGAKTAYTEVQEKEIDDTYDLDEMYPTDEDDDE